MGIAKVLAIATIWGGAALLSYLFHSFGILNGEGAMGITFGAIFLTFAVIDE